MARCLQWQYLWALEMLESPGKEKEGLEGLRMVGDKPGWVAPFPEQANPSVPSP